MLSRLDVGLPNVNVNVILSSVTVSNTRYEHRSVTWTVSRGTRSLYPSDRTHGSLINDLTKSKIAGFWLAACCLMRGCEV